MRYWWVNQNQTFRQEQSGGYMWSPKRNANRNRNPFYDNMREVAPGDLVLSFQGQLLRSIGVAHSYCYECPKPAEFGDAGLNWSTIGWRIEVRWIPLAHQIRPADHIGVLRQFLPEKYSPLRAETGHGLQNVYLAEIPLPMMQVLTSLIGYEARQLFDAPQIAQPEMVSDHLDATEDLYTAWESRQEAQLQEDDAVPETQRAALILSRRGQGQFRRNVRRLERACRVTGVENPAHLVASHCKPWRHADNEERLDGENGLLLTPSVDHLFDRGFISFEDDGRLLISPVADRSSLNRMGIPTAEPTNCGRFSRGQRSYLDYHRDSIFLNARRR